MPSVKVERERNSLVEVAEEVCSTTSNRRRGKETAWWNDRVKKVVEKKKNKAFKRSFKKVEEEEVVMILAHPEAPLLAMDLLPVMDLHQGSEAEVLAHADLPLGVLLLHTLEGLVDLASGDRPHLITGDLCLLQECTLPTT
uniref:Uncharacterized protein n=1 Tax=Timema shepardi TaxID=629360 RepID=A0A7R9AM93_TIMSH|nr:unnamed protein product [Timema shepardi]